jgi:hypothetical protein
MTFSRIKLLTGCLVTGFGLVLRGTRVWLSVDDVTRGVVERFQRLERAVNEGLLLVGMGGDAVAQILSHKQVCLGDRCRGCRTRWRRWVGHV